jgi:hypothetical protein
MLPVVSVTVLVSMPKLGMCNSSTLLLFDFQGNPTCQAESQLDYQSVHLQLLLPTVCRSCRTALPLLLMIRQIRPEKRREEGSQPAMPQSGIYINSSCLCLRRLQIKPTTSLSFRQTHRQLNGLKTCLQMVGLEPSSRINEPYTSGLSSPPILLR